MKLKDLMKGRDKLRKYDELKNLIELIKGCQSRYGKDCDISIPVSPYVQQIIISALNAEIKKNGGRMTRYESKWLRLATLHCNHCGKELCFDTRRHIFNKHPERHYNVIRECKTQVCPCCGETIDFTKANLVVHEPPVEIDSRFAPIN